MSVGVERFQMLLLEERDRIGRAIAAQDDHLAETATVTLDSEIDYTLEENSTRLLAAIDAALERIASRTYGICPRCGLAVAAGRLEAEPWAARCIDCQREAERG
jgi:RNA polymerase-binding protein DksA